MDVKRKKCHKKTFNVSEGVLLNTLKLFSNKCFIIFFNIRDIFSFLQIQDFKPKNQLMLSQKGNFYCKAL